MNIKNDKVSLLVCFKPKLHMTTKVFVSPNDLRLRSFQLGRKIVDSGFKPDFMVALWRGGAPVGCYVHEFLKYHNINTDHVAIRTSRYEGIDGLADGGKVVVHNLGYLKEKLRADSTLLIVDDIFDTGSSVTAFVDTLGDQLGENMPKDIRIATVFYKFQRNVSRFAPQYFIYSAGKNDWIVFPHELEGLTLEEIYNNLGNDIEEIVCKK